MADTEFEQFRQCFERLPQHLKATARTYTLVHDLALDDDTDGSSGSTRSDTEEEGGGGDGGGGSGSSADGEAAGAAGAAGARGKEEGQRRPSPSLFGRLDGPPRSRYVRSGAVAVAGATPVESGLDHGGTSLDSLIGGLSLGATSVRLEGTVTSATSVAGGVVGPPRERRRRRLPEIPQSAKNAAAAFWSTGGCSGCNTCRNAGGVGGLGGGGVMSLAAELGAAGAGDLPIFAPGGVTRPLLVLKCSGLDDAGSPDSQTDTLDSGHSTMHSPQLQHDSLSPNSGSAPGSPTSSAEGAGRETSAGGRLAMSQLELLEATHRGLYKFVPRHREEIEVEIGDLIYVQKEADDLWCEGVNLRTGRQGCFPSAYAVDLEYAELDPSEPRVRRERFLMRYMGSVETQHHKGTAVLAAAVRKMTSGQAGASYTPCVLEVSDKGLRMSDSGRGKRSAQQSSPPLDYFYSLKHVSFCAYLPRDQRFLGFITKHPQMQRFACHVFQGQESTRPVAESVGRAFQRFYQKYVETAFPVEDIYID